MTRIQYYTSKWIFVKVIKKIFSLFKYYIDKSKYLQYIFVKTTNAVVISIDSKHHRMFENNKYMRTS